ncbi:rhodanese-like domain-containing protein [Peribacillus glennii]|uniref:Rhodanese-like domain-containing protein n=1 Tax=Peribacillus glennii TaxID=2303991 RepID=A0A372LFE4_9BACI|nr:rhodanese-like domain-containing protein [Peribacillus glennii]RFU64682.1 rhodanese-like domain-containing protein [Peribacillus glennii]
MEYLNYVLIGLAIFFLLQRLLPVRGVKQITISALKSELADRNKQFIDVRTTGEFKTNHIKGFKNIPLHELSGKTNLLSKEKEVILICQSGMRSNKASKLLTKKGVWVYIF